MLGLEPQQGAPTLLSGVRQHRVFWAVLLLLAPFGGDSPTLAELGLFICV